jgi:hypothetical protein
MIPSFWWFVLHQAVGQERCAELHGDWGDFEAKSKSVDELRTKESVRDVFKGVENPLVFFLVSGSAEHKKAPARCLFVGPTREKVATTRTGISRHWSYSKGASVGSAQASWIAKIIEFKGDQTVRWSRKRQPVNPLPSLG